MDSYELGGLWNQLDDIKIELIEIGFKHDDMLICTLEEALGIFGDEIDSLEDE